MRADASVIVVIVAVAIAIVSVSVTVLVLSERDTLIKQKVYYEDNYARSMNVIYEHEALNDDLLNKYRGCIIDYGNCAEALALNIRCKES